MLLSNNFEYVTGLDFFKYFLPYHYAWCFGLLPILQFRNADPYNLPFSFARDPGITALFVIGTSIALSLVHFSFLRLFAKVQKYLMELKKKSMSNGLSATLDDDDARRRIFPHNIITKTQRDIIISVDKNSRFYF